MYDPPLSVTDPGMGSLVTSCTDVRTVIDAKERVSRTEYTYHHRPALYCRQHHYL